MSTYHVTCRSGTKNIRQRKTKDGSTGHNSVMASILSSTLRRAATQPKPPAFRAATLNLKRGMSGGAPTGGKSFKQSWLSDKGAWPVMGVIGFAVTFVTYWSFSTLYSHPDVRIDRANRQSVIRAKSGKNAEQEA